MACHKSRALNRMGQNHTCMVNRMKSGPLFGAGAGYNAIIIQPEEGHFVLGNLSYSSTKYVVGPTKDITK